MPKFATIVIDSVHEWARLTFSKDMRKSAGDFDSIRAVNNYPGATERINMVVRRFKDYQLKGITVVMTAHEQIEKIYARGGMITARGQAPQEPIGVKGWPNLPGTTCPTEVMGACDNVFRVRRINGKVSWICIPEPLGGGGDNWVAKDRFNAPALNVAGILPADYDALARLASAAPACVWSPPYIWLLYGEPGVGKTRSLLTFPRPMHIFDIDRGASVLKDKSGHLPDGITTSQYNSEECNDYPRFIADLEGANV
jgi:AAA domain